MSTIIKATVAVVVILIVAMFSGVMILTSLISATAAAEAGAASTGVLAIDPSDAAIADIPPILLPIYIDAARTCPGLPWTVIAGVGKVESDHGRYGGATIGRDGNVRPRIIGIALNGQNNTAIIGDTDNGVLDGDTVYDRAVGPFQFIPGSWAIFGVDGNSDGINDPHNLYDAIPAAVRHLCPNGTVTDIAAAIFAYNHSNAYVDLVLNWSTKYTGTVTAVPIAGYANPLAGLTDTQATRPHHDYPAIDIGVSPATPTFAMVDGTVVVASKSNAIFDGSTGRCGSTITIEGVDGVRYTYCHLSAVSVETGQIIVAGQQIALTGGQPGTPGAGNTTGPHLHLSMHGGGRSLCPQPVILAVLEGAPINPLAAPSSGCINGASIDWSAWLNTSISNN